MMQEFEFYRVKPRTIQAMKYERGNEVSLLAHPGIEKVGDDLAIYPPVVDGPSPAPATVERVAYGDWVVKIEGQYHRLSDQEFQEAFSPVLAGVNCVFCQAHLKNLTELKAHSATCEKHPAAQESSNKA